MIRRDLSAEIGLLFEDNLLFEENLWNPLYKKKFVIGLILIFDNCSERWMFIRLKRADCILIFF